ncbi:uncharacterized protein N7515_008853 [Penicillium bovifimosum]|uniref:Uncharacterized protein n=1 Tax=Penicillium bovifimosum TaxID=126998 RepID=A0A9W9GNS1_9EURO|nr:uncharacterized protein N7515_008853 [Penicillium bovifimosum]KAJ5125028.1 hypothetical protein N7515_008853 [Penicillium bovifimosum]
MSRPHGEDAHPEELAQNMPPRRNSSGLAPWGLRALAPSFIPQSQHHVAHPPGLAPSRLSSTSMNFECVVQPQAHAPEPSHGHQYVNTQPIGPKTQQTRTAQAHTLPIRAPQVTAPKVELPQIDTRALGPNAMVPGLWTPDPLSPDSLAPSPPPAESTHDLRPPLPFGRLPSTVEEIGRSFLTTTTIDPHNVYKTATRPCQIAHRQYTNWTRVAYSARILPETFLTRWHQALGEVRLVFGYSALPNIIVFNQFLSAVSANPEARDWVASLHVPMDRPLADSVMEETYRDFLKCKARRLGHPPSIWNPQPAETKAPTAEGGLKYYCPLHHILTERSMEDCPLLPRNASAKQAENMGGSKKGGSQKDRKKR